MSATSEPSAFQTIRPFRMMDAMVLIAMTAVGLAWNRWAIEDFYVYDSPFNRLSSYHKSFNWLMWLMVPQLALWSIAILTIGLWGTRAPLREMIRRPGMAACGSATMAIAFEAAWYYPFKIGHPNGVLPGIMVLRHCDTVGFAVGGSWLILTLGSLWKAQKDWIDRTGRLLGTAWIAVLIFFNFRNVLL